MSAMGRVRWSSIAAAAILCGSCLGRHVAAQGTSTPNALRPPNIPTQVVGPSVTLVSPQVVNTAQLQDGGLTISLFGLHGVGGAAAGAVQNYLNHAGQAVKCEAKGSGGYVCMMPDGNDLAQMILENGDAQTTPDAPDLYRQLEADAQAARRGIWSLPPGGQAPSGQAAAPRNILRDDADVSHVVPADLPANAGGGYGWAMDPQIFLVLGPNGSDWGYYDQGQQWHPMSNGGNYGADGHPVSQAPSQRAVYGQTGWQGGGGSSDATPNVPGAPASDQHGSPTAYQAGEGRRR